MWIGIVVDIWLYYYRPQRSWGKVIFFFQKRVSRILSTGGGGACVVGGHVWQGGVHGRGACVAGGHVWHACPPWQILRDTVNERAVYILLECILVLCSFGTYHVFIFEQECIPVGCGVPPTAVAILGRGGCLPKGIYTPPPSEQNHRQV